MKNTTLKNDWDRVHELAVEIANASSAAKSRIWNIKRLKMLRLLNSLLKKHGNNPSIVATKADYVLREAVRIKILHEALTLAKKSGDLKNEKMILSDLRTGK